MNVSAAYLYDSGGGINFEDTGGVYVEAAEECASKATEEYTLKLLRRSIS